MTVKDYMTTALAARDIATDPATTAKAMAKLRRHMRNKYGSLDWQSELSESGASNFWYFYDETLAKPSGQKTFNRGF